MQLLDGALTERRVAQRADGVVQALEALHRALLRGVRVQVLSSFIDDDAPLADEIPGTMIVSDEELAQRRAEQDAKGWKPAQPRPRKVSAALKAYAKLVMSADKGAVRDLSLLDE